MKRTVGRISGQITVEDVMRKEHTRPLVARMIDGSALTLPPRTPNEEAFLRKVEKASADSQVDDVQLAELIWSKKNPLLVVHPATGRPVADRKTYDDPAFQFMLDRVERKRIELGKLDRDAAQARFTMTVNEAADKLGVNPSTVRVAINAHRLVAMKAGGEYRLDPASVASYQVSTRGARAVVQITARAVREPGFQGPLLIRHGRQGEHTLHAKWDTGSKYANSQMIYAGVHEGEIPQGWKHAAVRFGNRATGNVQVFLLEPRKDEMPLKRDEIKFAGFFVNGAFRVKRKIVNPKKSTEAWLKFESH